MGQHAAYWQPYIESGQMVIFGPVLDGTGSWGLGVVETDDEEELRTLTPHAILWLRAELEVSKSEDCSQVLFVLRALTLSSRAG